MTQEEYKTVRKEFLDSLPKVGDAEFQRLLRISMCACYDKGWMNAMGLLVNAMSVSED